MQKLLMTAALSLGLASTAYAVDPNEILPPQAHSQAGNALGNAPGLGGNLPNEANGDIPENQIPETNNFGQDVQDMTPPQPEMGPGAAEFGHNIRDMAPRQ